MPTILSGRLSPFSDLIQGKHYELRQLLGLIDPAILKDKTEFEKKHTEVVAALSLTPVTFTPVAVRNVRNTFINVGGIRHPAFTASVDYQLNGSLGLLLHKPSSNEIPGGARSTIYYSDTGRLTIQTDEYGINNDATAILKADEKIAYSNQLIQTLGGDIQRWNNGLGTLVTDALNNHH